jgi:hypothetical protein
VLTYTPASAEDSAPPPFFIAILLRSCPPALLRHLILAPIKMDDEQPVPASHSSLLSRLSPSADGQGLLPLVHFLLSGTLTLPSAPAHLLFPAGARVRLSVALPEILHIPRVPWLSPGLVLGTDLLTLLTSLSWSEQVPPRDGVQSYLSGPHTACQLCPPTLANGISCPQTPTPW